MYNIHLQGQASLYTVSVILWKVWPWHTCNYVRGSYTTHLIAYMTWHVFILLEQQRWLEDMQGGQDTSSSPFGRWSHSCWLSIDKLPLRRRKQRVTASIICTDVDRSPGCSLARRWKANNADNTGRCEAWLTFASLKPVQQQQQRAEIPRNRPTLIGEQRGLAFD